MKLGRKDPNNTGFHFEVWCDHDNYVRKDGKRQQKQSCGCIEIDVCSGCGKEDCDGCPCGTSMRIIQQ